MNRRTPKPSLPVRLGLVSMAVALMIALPACTADPNIGSPVNDGPAVVRAGAEPTYVPVTLTGTLEGAEARLLTPINGIRVDLEMVDEKPNVVFTAATNIEAQKVDVDVAIESASYQQQVRVSLDIHELLVITGRLAREDASEVETASTDGGGIFSQLAADYGGIDAFLETVGDQQVDPQTGRVRGLSPAVQRFIRVLTGDEPTEEYVVAIDAEGNVLGSAATDEFTGDWRISLHRDASEVEDNPPVALLRGRAASDSEVEAGSPEVVCIEPLEVAELEEEASAFTRTRRTRAMLLRYITNEVAFQADTVDPTRLVRTLNVGSLTANDQSAKMANTNDDLLEIADDTQAASPFYKDGVFKQDLLRCGADERNEIEFVADITLDESSDVFVFDIEADEVTPASPGWVSTLSNFTPAPAFDAGIGFDLPAGAGPPTTPSLSSTGINESETVTSLESGQSLFPFDLATPLNRALNPDALRLQFNRRDLMPLSADDDILEPVAVDACTTDIEACDFEGGVTPIIDLVATTASQSVSVSPLSNGNVRIQASARLGRVLIRGQLVDDSAQPVSGMIVTGLCYDSFLALGRSARDGTFTLSVLENLDFPLECTINARSRRAGSIESQDLFWDGATPGTILISQPLIVRQDR